jgi:hypothetical protein
MQTCRHSSQGGSPVLVLFLAAVFLAYFLPLSVGIAGWLPIVFWALALFYAICTVRRNVFLLVLGLHAFLFGFYLLGIVLGSEGSPTAYYMRNLSTSFVVVLIIANAASDPKVPPLQIFQLKLAKILLRLLGFVIVCWLLLVYSNASQEFVGDRRDLVGYSYLTPSDLFAMTILAAIGSLRLRILEALFYILIGIAFTVFLGSRSSIIFFILSSTVFVLHQIGGVRSILILIFMATSYWVLYIGLVEKSGELFGRVYTLFSLGKDESVTLRGEFISNFLETLNVSIHCLVVPCHPERGMYVHNFISMVQHFGVAGLILTIVVATMSAVNYRAILRSRYFALFVFCALSVIFTRGWVSFVFPVLLGLLLGISVFKRKASPSARLVGN